MFNSQYYTCEQIDQRLLQGYLDDYNSQNNTDLTKEQFLTLLFNTIGRNSTVDNLVTQIGYYECDTAAGTAVKAITVANYNLFAGGSIKVKFVNKNTANNATLNLNRQGAKDLYYQGERASSTNSWDAGEVVEIYYDGTSYYANNIKGGSGSGVYDVSKEHPTSGPNSDGKFTLEYILNSNNVNELIPVNKRYPGMSIQFVSTSDNKYMQYRLMSNEWSADTDDWSFCGDDVLVENPEFVRVITDKDGRILIAIEKNGNVMFGAGVPQQVIDYINEKIEELSLDEYEDIVTFLGSLINGDKTLQQLLDKKVDGEYVENPEFVRVITDNNNKILEGTQVDGTKVIGSNLEVKGTVNGVDVEDVPNKVDKVEGKSLINAEYATGVAYINNPEFAVVFVDNENKICFGIKHDGTSYIEGDLEVNGNINNKDVYKDLDKNALSSLTVIENPEYIDTKVDSKNNILEAITIKGIKKINIPIDNGVSVTKTVNNPEFIDVLTDKDNKSILAIDKNGKIHFFAGVPFEISEFIIKCLEEQKQKMKNEPKMYFENFGYAPFIPLKNKPLIYSTNKWLHNAVSYPNGTLFYAAPYNTIKKVDSDGTETTVLSLSSPGVSRMIWMDSNLNIYTSPTISDTEQYADAVGLYKLAYGETQFTKVISLYDPNSSVPSETHKNTFTFWTMTEDADGNLYAGVYGNPYCPYIYKSTDGGDSWFFLKDMGTYVPNGIHIHFIEYNKYDNSLYCTVGEVNYLFKSVDGGNTWIDTKVYLDPMKSCSIHCVEDGIILGSDYGYWAMMYKVYPDGSYRTTTKTLANAIFSIRESDITGWIYAFGVIDHATTSRDWYPSEEAISDQSVLQDWIDSNPLHLNEWEEYYNSMINYFPDDAIRPQHSVILVSKDRGESWEILLRIPEQSRGLNGYFRNGEIAVPLSSGNSLIVSEGNHIYASAGGIDVSGTIFSRILSSNIVNPLN